MGGNEPPRLNEPRHWSRALRSPTPLPPSFLPTYARNDDHVLSTHPAQNSPRNAPWRKRHFHIQAPDGHELSFAKPLG